MGGNAGNRSPSPSKKTHKFPDFHPDLKAAHDNGTDWGSSYSAVSGSAMPQSRWQPRKETNTITSSIGMNGYFGSTSENITHGPRHSRQKSISEVIKNVRTRKGSIGHNAHEIADSLKAPVSPAITLLCIAWYTTSIMSNTSSKAILNTLPKPVTLSLVQFAFVSSWCMFAAWLASIYRPLKAAVPALKYGIQRPSKEIVRTTLPLAAFQIGGHILHSHAMSRIPVSLVHTIKGLSPLFTVLAYKIFYHINYSSSTYLSLVPLTLGVILACSADFSANLLGLIAAFGSALLFVTQNIVSKKLFNEASKAEADPPRPPTSQQRRRKPDKLNLLCYSSGLAFLLTSPLWLWSEGFGLISDFLQDASVDLSDDKPGAYDHGRLTLEFIFNGTFHFMQSLVAFALLSVVSPVTYSVASQIKRVAIVLFAIVWFGNNVSAIQALGIGLTFLGLYLYDRSSDSSHADRRASRMQMREDENLLPLVAEKKKKSDDRRSDHADGTISTSGAVPGVVYDARSANSRQMENKSLNGWLPSGTRQEDTWNKADMARQHPVVIT